MSKVLPLEVYCLRAILRMKCQRLKKYECEMYPKIAEMQEDIRHHKARITELMKQVRANAAMH